MKIVISGDRTEGKTTLLMVIADLLQENGWGVRIQHHLPIEELTIGVDTKGDRFRPRDILLCEENSLSEKVWDGKVKIDDLGTIKK